MTQTVAAALLIGVAAVAAGATERSTSRFASDHLRFRTNVDDHEDYKEVWGYTAPDGREYALIGTRDGTSVVNITDRRRPYETGFVPGTVATHRDIKTHDQFAYVVNDNGGGGLTVISLHDPEQPTRLATTDGGFSTAHNLWVDAERQFLYVAGSNLDQGGVRAYHLLNPASPTFSFKWEATYAHDVYARDKILYVSAIYNRSLIIVDTSNPAQPQTLAVIDNYPGAFTHNAWLTDDGRHVLTTDELSGSWVRMWNIEDPSDWYETDHYRPASGTTAIPHNVHVRGDLAFVSYYTNGVRVLDISDPWNLEEVGYFDTHLQTDGNGFEGCWGVYPHFPNSPELVIASDITRGLYVFEMDLPGAGRSKERVGPGVSLAPRGLELGPPVPNPARTGETSLELALASSESVVARVLDPAGRHVRTILDRRLPAGVRPLRWDGRDAAGRPVAAGVYFVQVRTDDRLLSQRVTILR